MIAVCDTSPLNYLVLIGAEGVLPALFGRVLAPPQVLAEMQHEKAPAVVSAWARQPSPWLETQRPQMLLDLPRLGPGETAAISLSRECAAVLLIDEREGAAQAQRLGLTVAGTLAVLNLAADKSLLSLPAAFAALKQTNFHGPTRLMADLLEIDAARRGQGQRPGPNQGESGRHGS